MKICKYIHARFHCNRFPLKGKKYNINNYYNKCKYLLNKTIIFRQIGHVNNVSNNVHGKVARAGINGKRPKELFCVIINLDYTV